MQNLINYYGIYMLLCFYSIDTFDHPILFYFFFIAFVQPYLPAIIYSLSLSLIRHIALKRLTVGINFVRLTGGTMTFFLSVLKFTATFSVTFDFISVNIIKEKMGVGIQRIDDILVVSDSVDRRACCAKYASFVLCTVV